MRRPSFLVGAAAAAVLSLVGAPPASAATYSRVGGSSRYETAANAALTAFPSGAHTAIVARGDLYADALAASYLAGTFPAAAGAGAGAPILLTDSNSLSSETESALSSLKVSDVYIVGGLSAVSQHVADQLAALHSTSP